MGLLRRLSLVTLPSLRRVGIVLHSFFLAATGASEREGKHSSSKKNSNGGTMTTVSTFGGVASTTSFFSGEPAQGAPSNRSVPVHGQTELNKNKTTPMKYRIGE